MLPASQKNPPLQATYLIPSCCLLMTSAVQHGNDEMHTSIGSDIGILITCSLAECQGEEGPDLDVQLIQRVLQV